MYKSYKNVIIKYKNLKNSNLVGEIVESETYISPDDPKRPVLEVAEFWPNILVCWG